MTLSDLVTVFVESKSVTKSRVHCTYTNMVSSWWSGGANLKKSMCGQMFSQDNGHLILTKEDLQASLCVSVCLRARACTWLNNIRLSKKFTTLFRITRIFGAYSPIMLALRVWVGFIASWRGATLFKKSSFVSIPASCSEGHFEYCVRKDTFWALCLEGHIELCSEGHFSEYEN